MGFMTLIDVLGSAVIGGILLLILFNLNQNATQNTYNFSSDLTVQEGLVSTIDIIEYDFRKIGFCENPNAFVSPFMAITYADTNRIDFKADINRDGVMDEIKYIFLPDSNVTGTENPNDRVLLRYVNGTPSDISYGTTGLKFRYFDALDEEIIPPITVAPTGIMTFQIDLSIESTYGYDQQFPKAFWRQIRLSSRNLSNR